MKKSKDTTIIFQEGRLSKILKVNRKTLKQFFTTLSLLVTALIISMVLTILFYQSRISQVKGNQSATIQSLTDQNAQKAMTIESLTNENAALITKMSQPSEKNSALALFSESKGFKDITNRKLISLEETKTEYRDGKASIKFNVMNNKTEGKVSGYAFTILYTDSGVMVKPSSETLKQGSPLEFHQGESFTVSRFRPFETRFKVSKNTRNVTYKVLIFSKTGDLVTNQTIGPIDLKSLNQ